MKKITLLISLPLFFAACGDDDSGKKSTPKPQIQELSVIEAQLNREGTLQVADEEGNSLGGAKILFGRALNDPFEGNFLTTDAAGKVAIPAGWNEAMPITAGANGYVRLTYLAQSPRGLQMRLRKVDVEPTLEVKGVTTGHGVRDFDGNADFGLVMSGLTRNDLMAFDVNKVISNKIDTVTAVGQTLEIPSNVTLPRQKESYLFFNVTLDKGNYRLYFGEKKSEKIFAAKGRFPFKKVVDQMRADKKFYDVINDFDIKGGVLRSVSVTNGVRLDLPVDELNFEGTRGFRAPNVRGDEVLLALSAAHIDGVMVPTDIKRLVANQSVEMGVMSGKTSSAVGVLKRASEFQGNGPGADRLSAVILPFTAAVAPQFLNLIEDPRLAANGDLLLPRPTRLGGVNELATTTLLSEVRELGTGENKIPFLIRKWEVYAPGWNSTMTLPKWPDGTRLTGKNRWEVTYVGSSLKDSSNMGQDVVNAATHVTHSSFDF